MDMKTVQVAMNTWRHKSCTNTEYWKYKNCTDNDLFCYQASTLVALYQIVKLSKFLAYLGLILYFVKMLFIGVETQITLSFK